MLQKGKIRAWRCAWASFLRESRAELRKVTWPNRQELVTYTAVVIVTTAIVAIFLGVIDLVVSQLLGLLGRI